MEEAIKIPVENDGHAEKVNKNGRYPRREWRLLKEWWNNHILPQHVEERSDVAFSDNHLNLYKALRSINMNTWLDAMQEEFDSLIANNT
jgi:hypothetical protein